MNKCTSTAENKLFSRNTDSKGSHWQEMYRVYGYVCK